MTPSQLISLFTLIVVIGIFIWLVWFTRPGRVPMELKASVEVYDSFVKLYVIPVIVQDLIMRSDTVDDYYLHAKAFAKKFENDRVRHGDISTSYSTDIRLCAYTTNADLDQMFQVTIDTILKEPRSDIQLKLSHKLTK